MEKKDMFIGTRIEKNFTDLMKKNKILVEV